MNCLNTNCNTLTEQPHLILCRECFLDLTHEDRTLVARMAKVNKQVLELNQELGLELFKLKVRAFQQLILQKDYRYGEG